MKKIVILSALFFAMGTPCFSQDSGPNMNYTKHSDQYIASYYTPVLWGVNGFRTVEEENRIMEQTLAELRRQRQLEDMTPEERADMRKRREIKQEIRTDAVQARKGKEDAKKQKAVQAKQAVKKDTVLAKKEEPKKKK